MPEEHPSVQAVLDATAPPTELDKPVFAESWQARAFAVAVALYDVDPERQDRFRRRLIEEIQANDRVIRAADVDADYYRRWLDALERLLLEDGAITPEELRSRAGDFASGRRTASEFIEGDHEFH